MSSRLPPHGRIPDPSPDPDDGDDDGIPLQGHASRPKRAPQPERAGACWVCQCPVTVDQATRVAKKALPVCPACWQIIPPADRVKIGLQMMGHDDLRPLLEIAAMILARTKGDAERMVDGDMFGGGGRGN